MKLFSLALAGALLATSALPALAAPNLSVPVATTAPSTNPNADQTAFAPAAVAQLGWNATTGKDATQDTGALVTTDGKNLYVRFDASQQQRIVSSSFSNGQTSGDEVAVDVWPSGADGTHYTFAAAPDGTSSATASSGTAPTFSTAGSVYPGGYTVTMTIPLAQLHGPTGANWNVQFARRIAADGSWIVWSHDGASSMAGDLAQAGTMTLPPSVAKN